MKKIILIAVIGAVLPALFASSCGKHFKTVAKTTHDSTIYNVRDSVVVTEHLRYKDSVIIKDTLIRVKYDRAEYSFPANSTKDTAIRSGRATLRKTVNNGVVTVQADCDSFDILINDQRIVISQKQTEYELLSKEFSDYKSYHASVEVKEAQKGFFGRLWAKVQGYFSWLGLIAFAYIIFKIVKKFSTGFVG